MQFQACPLDNAHLESSEASFLVDTIHPGAPLVISFGFVDWNKRPGFDFYGRLKKLEAVSATPLNKILIRDCENAWYQRGVPGLGATVDEVAQALRQMVQAIAPGPVITIGQSMGAYAALMFGALMQVDKVIAFGPLSFLDSKEALLYHERRWLGVMQELERNPPPVWYPDLPALFRRVGQRPQCHIIFGTKPDKGASESVNLDVLHAMRYAALPNCRIFPFPASGHTVVKHLIDTGQIDRLLGKYILEFDFPDAESKSLTESWLGWLAENLALGANQQELLLTLTQHGFSEAAGQEALAKLSSEVARS